ncbi:hypothetical protein [Nocardia sp. NPDC005366]|uniref:hypothetical protein n=1 Tax=Nocardia sp. NPDC005366 TaxID=3156878 RepID=UPI00339E60BF
MVSSRARIAGPVIAVGAVSVGLVLIGACGVGHHDIYVPPPPLEFGPAAAVATVRDGSTVTAPKVIIPPSPTWQMAPAGPPRRPAGYTPPSSTSAAADSESAPESPESSTRPSRTTTPRTSTTEPPPAAVTETEDATTTTRNRTLSVEPSTVGESAPTHVPTPPEESAALEESRTVVPDAGQSGTSPTGNSPIAQSPVIEGPTIAPSPTTTRVNVDGQIAETE